MDDLEIRVKAAAEGLSDLSALVRCDAATSLRQFGERVGPAVPALITALRDGSRLVRGAAIETLAVAGPAAAPAVATLAALASRDPNRHVRRAAVCAIGSLGDSALEAVPALVDATIDPAESVRHAAWRSLKRLGLSAMPMCFVLLEEGEWRTRAAAAKILGYLTSECGAGPPLRSAAIKALTRRLRDQGEHSSVRETARASIGVLS